MSVGQLAVVFTITWWLVFFVTLPFGVRRLDNPDPGLEQGAPERPRLWIKAGVTTLATVVITGGIYLAADAGWLSLRDWSRPTLESTPR